MKHRHNKMQSVLYSAFKMAADIHSGATWHAIYIWYNQNLRRSFMPLLKEDKQKVAHESRWNGRVELLTLSNNISRSFIQIGQNHDSQPPTCDATREGVAHGHWGKRSCSTKGSDGGWGATKWSDGRGVAIVVAVGTLEGRWLAYLGGVWPIVAHVGGNRGRVRSIWSVLQWWSFVLFTFDTAHYQACKEMARG